MVFREQEEAVGGNEEHEPNNLQIQPVVANRNGNSNNNQNNVPVVGPYLAIQDEEEWYRQHGLMGEPQYGADSYANQKEARDRLQALRDYQQTVHAKVFQNENDQQQQKELLKIQKLRSWQQEGLSIRFLAADQQEILRENISTLAQHSDTIFTMVNSRHHYHDDKQSPSDSQQLEISLADYSRDSVLAFLNWLEQYAKAQEQPTTIATPTPQEDYVIECCQLAHYLQCHELLESLLPLLIESIDSENALSMVQLADQLHLPSLLEASLNHMLHSLNKVEEHDIWNDLTPELQSQIQSVQGILKRRPGPLFFSSLDEYLALLAEQVDYYRERLQDAQAAQSQIQERASSSRAWQYAQTKIDQQQTRVETLKQILKEQKQLFRPS